MPKRIDANQPDIVAALRAIGATVQVLSAVGHGCPDILVKYRNKIFVIEIKVDNAKLTPAEETWWKCWGGEPCVARSSEEAIAILQYHTQEV